jgi:hypothetical protein
MHEPRGFKKLTRALKYLDLMHDASKTLLTGVKTRRAKAGEIRIWQGPILELHLYYASGWIEPLAEVWDAIGSREELFGHRRASFA